MLDLCTSRLCWFDGAPIIKCQSVASATELLSCNLVASKFMIKVSPRRLLLEAPLTASIFFLCLYGAPSKCVCAIQLFSEDTGHKELSAHHNDLMFILFYLHRSHSGCKALRLVNFRVSTQHTSPILLLKYYFL